MSAVGRWGPAWAGALGIAAGLWLSGAGLSCVVTHRYDASELDCPAALRPECCDSCARRSTSEPSCTERGWACPPPSVSSLECPDRALTCRPPVVHRDGGSCSDGGEPTQERYEFPGCAPITAACPNDVTLSCALQALKAEHDACRFSSDCVQVPFNNGCAGWGLCPPFTVAAGELAAFVDAGEAEVRRYCGCASCWFAFSCQPGLLEGVPRCVYGRCTWVPRQVAYRCADRLNGACFPACAEDEACFTQVACQAGPDGGSCAPPLDGGALLAGDDLCHPRCAADGGCPEGQACFQVAFHGCGLTDGGAPPVQSICCAADAGCR